MRGTVRFLSGAWRLQVKLPPAEKGGKPRYRTMTVKAPDTRDGRRQAERALASFVIDCEETRDVGGRYTVEQWWDYATTLRAGTIAGSSVLADDLAGVYLKKYLGDRWLHTLTATDFIGMYGRMATEPGLRGKGLSAASVRRHHNSIRAVLELAVEDGVLDRNPCERVAKKLPQIQDPVVTPASEDAVRRLLAAAAEDPMMLAFVALAATTGQRRGSLLGVQWSDLDGGVLTFRRAWSRGPDGWAVRPTKTGSTVRFPLSSQTLGVLNGWYERTESDHAACGMSAAWVFTREPGVPMVPTTMTKRWEGLRDEAGCPGVKLKDLRPYFATSLLRAGVDIKTVQELGGWAGPQILLRHYAGFANEVAAAAVHVHAETTFGQLSHPPATVTLSDG